MDDADGAISYTIPSKQAPCAPTSSLSSDVRRTVEREWWSRPHGFRGIQTKQPVMAVLDSECAKLPCRKGGDQSHDHVVFGEVILIHDTYHPMKRVHRYPKGGGGVWLSVPCRGGILSPVCDRSIVNRATATSSSRRSRGVAAGVHLKPTWSSHEDRDTRGACR